jgi:hypothetical protein
MYQAEAEVAKALGFEYALVGYEALAVERDPVKAVRRVVVEPTPILGLYRGWMLKPGQYTQLYQALADKGILLINDPAAYRHCHYLPESYEVIRGQTPVSVWLKTAGGVDLDEMMALLQPFGSKPLILKDFVKSQKHYWREACFIPSASDREAVARIVTRFLELQGDDLNEGLVFREYVELEPLTTHSRSGMPLTQEYRLFVLDGEPIHSSIYWEEGDYQETQPEITPFRGVLSQVKSRFFTLDIARQRDGDWLIIELGDGQVAGLPERVEIKAFYQAIRDKLG